MESASFDALTRRFSRADLEAAGKAISGSVSVARKNKRKKPKGDVNKRCKQQAADWISFITILCPDESQPQCEAFIACAAPLEICNFSSFLTCLTDSLQS
jgi:hypothetical protein